MGNSAALSHLHLLDPTLCSPGSRLSVCTSSCIRPEAGEQHPMVSVVLQEHPYCHIAVAISSREEMQHPNQCSFPLTYSLTFCNDAFQVCAFICLPVCLHQRERRGAKIPPSFFFFFFSLYSAYFLFSFPMEEMVFASPPSPEAERTRESYSSFLHCFAERMAKPPR